MFKTSATPYWMDLVHRARQKGILAHSCPLLKWNKAFAKRQWTGNGHIMDTLNDNCIRNGH